VAWSQRIRCEQIRPRSKPTIVMVSTSARRCVGPTPGSSQGSSRSCVNDTIVSSTRWNRSTVRDILVSTRSPGMMGKEILGVEPLEGLVSGGTGHGWEVPDRRLRRQVRK